VVVYVKVTKAGDSSFKVGQVVSAKLFIQMVFAVLVKGGEMPVAMYFNVAK